MENINLEARGFHRKHYQNICQIHYKKVSPPVPPHIRGFHRSLEVSRGIHMVRKVKRKRRLKTKVGRNDPCPCGSEKKFKNCCFPKDHSLKIEEERYYKKRADITRTITHRDEINRKELFDWKQFRKSPFEEKISVFNLISPEVPLLQVEDEG